MYKVINLSFIVLSLRFKHTKIKYDVEYKTIVGIKIYLDSNIINCIIIISLGFSLL